jgi:hypothetical protein
MTKLKFLSAVLIGVAMLATPAMARDSHVTSRHLAENANASIGARYIGGDDAFRGNHVGGGFDATPGGAYGSRDVWGHWGTYYGPMVPTP